MHFRPKMRKSNLNYRFHLQQLYVISNFMFEFEFGPKSCPHHWPMLFIRVRDGCLCVCNCAFVCAPFETSIIGWLRWRATEGVETLCTRKIATRTRRSVAVCRRPSEQQTRKFIEKLRARAWCCWKISGCSVANTWFHPVGTHIAHKLHRNAATRSCTLSVKCHTFIYHFFKSHIQTRPNSQHTHMRCHRRRTLLTGT